MHTLEVHTVEDGKFYCHHNGDFSGDVEIFAPDRKIFNRDNGHVQIPFEVLKGLVADYVRQKRIEFYEQATSDEVLEGRQ